VLISRPLRPPLDHQGLPQQPASNGSGVQAYVFASLLYFIFCFAMSAYGKRLERPSLKRTPVKAVDAA
jgi:hypothetical protein